MNIMITCFCRIWHKLRRSIIVFVSCIVFLGASGKQAFASKSLTLASQAVTTITPAAMRVLMSNPYTMKHMTMLSTPVFLGISGVSAFFAIGMGSNLLIVSKNLETSIPAVLGTFPIGFVSLNSAAESILTSTGTAASLIGKSIAYPIGYTLIFLGNMFVHPQKTSRAIPGALETVPGIAQSTARDAYSAMKNHLTEENLQSDAALITALLITPADADSAGTGFRYYDCQQASGSPDNTTVKFDLEQCNATSHGYYNCSAFYSDEEEAPEESVGCDAAYWSAVFWNAIPTAAVGYFTGHQLVKHIVETAKNTGNAAINIVKNFRATEKIPFVSQSMIKAERFSNGLVEYLKGTGQFEELGLTTESVSNLIESTVGTGITVIDPDNIEAGSNVLAPLNANAVSINPEQMKALVDEASAYTSRNLDQGTRYDIAFPSQPSNWAAVGSGLAQAAVAAVGIKYLLAVLTNVFNAGKLIEYAKKEGFEFLEAGIIKYPDGHVVNVTDPSFKANSAIINNDINSKAISSVGVSMALSETTYTVQGLLVSTIGAAYPAMSLFRLLSNYCCCCKERRAVQPPNNFKALVISGIIVFGGAVPYFMNLWGAAPAVDKITDYRQAIGDEVFTNNLSGETQVGITIGSLCGFLTFGSWEGIGMVVLVAYTIVQHKTKGCCSRK